MGAPSSVVASDKVDREPEPEEPLPPLPPIGPLVKSTLEVGNKVFCMRQTVDQVWKSATIDRKLGEDQYKIRFDGGHSTSKKHGQFRNVGGKHLAYMEPPSSRIPVGTRVIGL